MSDADLAAISVRLVELRKELAAAQRSMQRAKAKAEIRQLLRHLPVDEQREFYEEIDPQ